MEPVNLWQPQTDKYKAMAEQGMDPKIELQKKLVELHEEKREDAKEKKAPIGIQVVTWCYFLRASFYVLLLIVLVGFPQSGPSAWITTNLNNFIHLPSNNSAAAARQREMAREAEANGYAAPVNSGTESSSAETGLPPARNMVIAYLLFVTGITLVVGFMLLGHSWQIRWVAMVYSGTFVAKASINYIAGLASGVGAELPPGQTQTMLLSFVINLCIFLYLAFWPGVEEWFEEQH